jgi:hypothetical protein
LKVGDHFNPEVGFIRRDDFKRTFVSTRFSPRPTSIKQVRQFTWQGSLEYIVNGAGSLESRQQTGLFSAEFENSDRFSASLNRYYELLVQPFKIPGGSTVGAGGYDFSDVQATYALGQQRRVSGTIGLQTALLQWRHPRRHIERQGVSAEAVVREPTISINRSASSGDFTTSLLRLAATMRLASTLRECAGAVQHGRQQLQQQFRFRGNTAGQRALRGLHRRTHTSCRLSGLKNRARREDQPVGDLNLVVGKSYT